MKATKVEFFTNSKGVRKMKKLIVLGIAQVAKPSLQSKKTERRTHKMARMVSKRHVVYVLLMIAVAVVAVAFVATSAQAQVYPSGMVSYWKFDEGSGTTAYDSVGDNDGTILGDATWTTGQVNAALYFDGSGDIVNSNKIRLAHSYSLAAWVYPQDQTRPYGVIIGRKSRQQSNYSLNYHEGGQFGVGHEDTADNDFSATAGDYSLGQWYFVVGTYEESTKELKLYVDGNLIATTEDVNPPDPGYDHADDRATSIGATDHPIDGITKVLNGLIDEAAIYDRALTPAEIQQHYQNGLNGLGYEEPITVIIDIKPGSDPNSINPRSKGVIPVAILTTEEFDATTVDPLSVEFGPNGAAESHSRGHIEDVDDDGDDDLMLHFRTQETGIQCGDTSASLVGETFSGEAIEGTDSINTVGCK